MAVKDNNNGQELQDGETDNATNDDNEESANKKDTVGSSGDPSSTTNGVVTPTPAAKTKTKGTVEKKEKTKMIGIFALFRFTDGLDRFLIMIGTLCASINGLALPVFIIVMGTMLDSFLDTSILYVYLETIPDYLNYINKTQLEVIANPTILNCHSLLTFYGGNITCVASLMNDRILNKMTQYAIYYCLIGIVVILMGYGQVTFWMIAAERQCHRMRKACLQNILRQDIGWFDTHATAELNTRLSDDILKIQYGIGDKVGSFWQWSFTAVTSMVVGFVYGWKLALVLLAVSPLFIIAGVLTSKLTASVTAKELEAYAHAGRIAEEVFGAIRTVVAFGGQDKDADRYKDNLSSAQAYGIKKGFAKGISMGFIWFSMYCCYGLGIWYGSKLFIEDDTYNLSTLIIVFLTVVYSAIAVGSAIPSLQAISAARGAAYIIHELVDAKSPIDSYSEEGLKPESIKGTISFENVHFNYPARPDVKVLDGLNIQADPGQTVALIGSSGCGKSTTVQLLLRFYDPQEGKIKIDGQDITDINIKWLRKSLGLVSQEPVLFATTIAENIRYGREDVTMEEIEKATKEANVYNFIVNLPEKFETMVGERGAQLSGGQKQRLAIARALVRDPKILLLDEATSALDTESESIVQDALDKARQGRTTIVIAHRLSTVKTADIIVGLQDGKVVEMGSHDELMNKQGIYYQLVMNQNSAANQEDQEHQGKGEKGAIEDISPNHEPAKETSAKEKEKKKEAPPKAPFTRLMKYNSPEWYFILMGCFGSLFNGTIQPGFVLVFSRVMDTFSVADVDKQREDMRMYSLILVGIGVFSFLTYFLQGYMFARSGEALTARLRDLCFRSIIRQDISFFDDNKNTVGALTTRLAVDASLVQGVTGGRLGGVLMNIVNMGAGLIIAFVYGWKMTLVILGLAPFMFIGGLMATKLMAGQSGKDKEALEGAGKISVECIGNIRTVASLTKEPTFLNLYMGNLEMPYKKAMKNAHAIGLTYGISQAMLFFAYAVAFVFGAYMIEEGEMKFDEVFLVFSAIVFGAVGLGNASAFAPDVGKAKASAECIVQIIDSQPSIDYASQDGIELSGNYCATLSFKDVVFSYPNRQSVKVLRGLTFAVFPGETVALVGTSGCGKSTSVQLMERFYDVISGHVALDICNVKDLNIQWLREQIGVVSQEPVLFDTTIAENIAYGDNSRTVEMDEIISAARDANIHNFIASLPDGYNTNVGSKGTQLSGGQKQRIAIARALVRNPKILLLDEATSALDTESEKIVQEALDKARQGRTCIVIAHRLSTVRTADKICVVKHGKVSESGTHSELMAKQGFYYKLVKKSVREK